MDRIRHVVHNALVDERARVAHQFEGIARRTDKATFAKFLVVYCAQGGQLADWLTDWNQLMGDCAIANGQGELAAGLMQASRYFHLRHSALQKDRQTLVQWLIGKVDGDWTAIDNSPCVSSGMKQLRHLFQSCLKRKRFVTWVMMINEIERLRIIHSVTLIKLCEVFFGRKIVGCFSHIQHQHQQGNALFWLCDNLLATGIKKLPEEVDVVIDDVKSSIQAYTQYIESCFKLASQGEPCVTKV